MGHQRGAEPARADRGKFLGQHKAVEIVEAGAVPAILLGVAQPEDTRFRRLLVEFARQLAFGLPAVDVRRDLARDETADALRQRFVGFVITGRAGAASRRRLSCTDAARR